MKILAEQSTAFTRVPVTIITGFLGAGKTTLLNRILTEHTSEKIAVIMNEYGEVGVDSDLLVGTEETVIQMDNGCICCKVRGDLGEALVNLMKARLGLVTPALSFDRVVIETTGLADPAPVVQTFIADENVAMLYEVDAIVTVVDAKHAALHLDEGHEAVEQIAFADVVLLNKVDLVSSDELDMLQRRIVSLNPTVAVYRSERSAVNLSKLLGIKAFDLSAKLTVNPGFLTEEAHDHDHSITSMVFQTGEPLDMDRFDEWLASWVIEKGQDVFRYKGILNFNDYNKRVVFQGVHMLFESVPDRIWKKGERRETKFVIIGRNLDKEWFRKGFEKCLVKGEKI